MHASCTSARDRSSCWRNWNRTNDSGSTARARTCRLCSGPIHSTFGRLLIRSRYCPSYVFYSRLVLHRQKPSSNRNLLLHASGLAASCIGTRDTTSHCSVGLSAQHRLLLHQSPKLARSGRPRHHKWNDEGHGFLSSASTYVATCSRTPKAELKPRRSSRIEQRKDWNAA